MKFQLLKTMTEIKAQLKFLRISPRKVRLLTDLIKKKPVLEAQNLLRFVNKRGKTPLMKLLKSAINNANNNFKLEPKDLFIRKIEVNEGAKLKRMKMKAMGRSASILKRTSHIIIVLEKINSHNSIKTEKTGTDEKNKTIEKPKQILENSTITKNKKI